MTRRTKVGFGIGLVVIGLVLAYNYGLSSLLHSPPFGQYNLTDPFTIEVSAR